MKIKLIVLQIATTICMNTIQTSTQIYICVGVDSIFNIDLQGSVASDSGFLRNIYGQSSMEIILKNIGIISPNLVSGRSAVLQTLHFDSSIKMM